MKTYLSSINGKMRYDNMPWNADAMISDLALKPVLNAMSGGDDFLLKNSVNFVLNGLISMEEIMYRQEVLKDFINNSVPLDSILFETIFASVLRSNPRS